MLNDQTKSFDLKLLFYSRQWKWHSWLLTIYILLIDIYIYKLQYILVALKTENM